ncbi:MAG: hypothetical protein GY723_15460 [bacterium]|nr:hypothetical protein [bacterium]MCP5065939.1 hypothetical protein [bacterium]
MTDDDRDSRALVPRRAQARKERVLHTRVPEVLAQELKRLAESMRVPVSNVVRTCLEDAVDAVSSMSHRAEGELQGLADRLGERPERPSHRRSSSASQEEAPAAPLAGVIGFQPLLLAQNTVCSLSGRELRTGEQAYLGIRSGTGPPLIIAPECLPRSFEAPDE